MYNTDMLSNFRFSGDYTINLDWDAWLRMADMIGTFVYVPQILLQQPDTQRFCNQRWTRCSGKAARGFEDTRKALAKSYRCDSSEALFTELQLK